MTKENFEVGDCVSWNGKSAIENGITKAGPYVLNDNDFKALGNKIFTIKSICGGWANSHRTLTLIGHTGKSSGWGWPSIMFKKVLQCKKCKTEMIKL